MLARFVVDSHTKSRPKGANLEDRIPTDVDDDPLASVREANPDHGQGVPVAIRHLEPII